MPRYAISLIGMRRPAGSAECLERMIQNAGNDCHFFVTANGCPETAEAFNRIAASNDRVTVTVNAENEGFQVPHHRQFVAAANMGCEYVLIANDDIAVPEGFLDALSAPMDEDSQIAVTGPEGNCTHLNHAFHGQPGSGPPEYIEMSCGMIRVAALSQLRQTLWCPGLSFVYGEDSSLSLFLREKGWKIALAPIKVGHVRSVTVNGHADVRQKCMAAQEANHARNMVRWGYYLERRRFDFPIILRRKMALGDVILTTALVRAIAKACPLCPIFVETLFPEVFANNPNVVQADKTIQPMDGQMVIDLDMAYENRPMTHIAEAFLESAREQLPGLGDIELRTELFPDRKDMEWAAAICDQLGPRVCVIGYGPSHWPGKHFAADKWQHVVDRLVADGWKVIIVGTVPLKNQIRHVANTVLDMTGQTSLLQLAALCARAQLFAGIDSGPLHVAMSVGTPTVGIFGCTRSRYISTFGAPHAAVESPMHIEGSGARHVLSGAVFLDSGKACMDNITPDDVMAAIQRVLD